MFILFNFYLILIVLDIYRSVINFFEEYDNFGRIGKFRKLNMEMYFIYYLFGRFGGGVLVKDDVGKVNIILYGYLDVSI